MAVFAGDPFQRVDAADANLYLVTTKLLDSFTEHLGRAWQAVRAVCDKPARGERRLTGKKLRLLNEVPGLAAAVIVVLVVVKPF